MIRSSERILTTHIGSLYRSTKLLDFYRRILTGESYDEAGFQKQVQFETQQAVQRQAEINLDIPSDGEMSRFSFRTYFDNRITGVEMRHKPVPAWTSRDRTQFAGFYAQAIPHYWGTDTRALTPVCVGPIKYDPSAALQDIANFRSALKGKNFTECFFPSQVVQSVTFRMENEYYRTDEEFDIAYAEALREEYRLITSEGFILQLDDPFITLEWEIPSPAMSVTEYRKEAQKRIELLNHSLIGVPDDKVRFHVCWGSWHGPHWHDIGLKEIVDLILQINAQAYSIEAANPQHEHEWEVWKRTKLPDGKILIPGVVTHKSYVVEHPDLVAQRLVQYANIVGRENIIAAPDCGMGGRIHEELGWAKLQTLVDGARRASAELWRR